MLAVFILSTGSAHASDASSWVRSTLENASYNYEECSIETAAINSTLSRVNDINLPEYGKVIVVNITSGIVTAYEDGVPVIESKGVVGKASTPTPEMNTHVTFVRPNPTWTVPRSIIKRNKWIDRLHDDPEFFVRNNFKIMSGGKTISAYDAAYNPDAGYNFIQMPGAGNALGLIKIGIQNDQAIYLHDTNDPGKFNQEVRAASAGCVRIERITDIASWILDISPYEMTSLVEDGSTRNIKPPQEVKVIIGYWTAWPDNSGHVRFYPDIYGKDSICGRQTGGKLKSKKNYSPVRLEPRFIPGPIRSNAVTPQWTEFEAIR